MKNRIALGVDNGSVVDHGPAADHGFEKIVEIAIGSQVVSDGLPNGLGITCIHAGAAQIRSCFGREKCQIRGEVRSGGISGGYLLA